MSTSTHSPLDEVWMAWYSTKNDINNIFLTKDFIYMIRESNNRVITCTTTVKSSDFPILYIYETLFFFFNISDNEI